MIGPFRGEYRFLSNFYPSIIKIDGIEYPTVEHAYQAMKTLDVGQRKWVASQATPGKAKRAGRQVTLRQDWGKIQIWYMELLVSLKFTLHKPLTDQLLSTGNTELVEINHWGDIFWGVCNGKGENHLGKILMRVRNSISSTTTL